MVPLSPSVVDSCGVSTFSRVRPFGEAGSLKQWFAWIAETEEALGVYEVAGDVPHMSSGRASAPIIRGNTVRVYLFVLKNGPSELREVQRGLKLSTPSLAFYHLSRLVESGLVNRTEDGKYVVVSDISADLIDGYVKFGRRIIPQLFFLSLIFTIILAYYVYLIWRLPLDRDDIVTIVYSLSIIVLWYETIRVWRRLSG
jgi:hypothetical protein